MKYNIIATTQIPVADEAALKTVIEQIEAFVKNKDGTTKIIARTVEEDPEE